MNRYTYTDEGKKHLHTLDKKPLIGTSTVVGILAKTLTWWASGQAVGTLGWTATQSDPNMRLEVATVALEGIKELDGKGWLKRLDLAYKAHSVRLKDAASDGTDLHAELEAYVKSVMGGEPYTIENEKVAAFAKWAETNVKKFLYSEAHCYSETFWVGGIFDCLAEMNDGKIALFDFKSSKEAYFGHYVQLGGYAVEIEENGVLDSQGNKLGEAKIDTLFVVPFGADDMLPRPYYDVDNMKGMFINAVNLYKGNDTFGK